MKFEIEVTDFWLEEEELSVALKDHVTKVVIHAVTKSIEDRVASAITTRVEATITNQVSKIIEAKLNELVDTGMILVDRKEISIADRVKQVFEQNTGWSNPRDQIARLAEAFGKDLKNRYDAAFANRIVVKINEQGMLKDEVVRLLLNP